MVTYASAPVVCIGPYVPPFQIQAFASVVVPATSSEAALAFKLFKAAVHPSGGVSSTEQVKSSNMLVVGKAIYSVTFPST
jgi:hypothetical protein